jgi:hypothetical protein
MRRTAAIKDAAMQANKKAALRRLNGAEAA